MAWRLLLIGTALMLGACAVSFTQIRGPDGKHLYVMNCSGFEVDRTDCAHLARRLCPRGYRVVDPNTLANGADGRRYRAIGQKNYALVSCV
jgi:hypothetical protein